MNDSSSPPHPTLTGPEPPGLRRWKEMLASGVEIPVAPSGERFVSFALDAQDHKAYQDFLLAPRAKRPITPISIMFVVSIALVLTTLIPTRSSGHTSLLSKLIAGAMPLLIFLLAIPLMTALQRRKLRKDAPDIFGPQTVSISPQYISTQTLLGDGRLKWRGIVAVDQTKNHIFLRVANGTAYIIPKWAFPHAIDAEAFYNEAKQFHDAAKGNV